MNQPLEIVHFVPSLATPPDILRILTEKLTENDYTVVRTTAEEVEIEKSNANEYFPIMLASDMAFAVKVFTLQLRELEEAIDGIEKKQLPRKIARISYLMPCDSTVAPAMKGGLREYMRLFDAITPATDGAAARAMNDVRKLFTVNSEGMIKAIKMPRIPVNEQLTFGQFFTVFS